MNYETYSNPHSDEHDLTPLRYPNHEGLLNTAEPRSDIDHAESNNTAIVGSRRISAITGKNHSHVIRDIRSLLEETKDDPDLDHVKFITDSRGYTTEIKLTPDLALALVSGYSGQMRLAMIRAIHKLEPKPRIGRTISTKNYVALASITAELVDTREQLTDQIIKLELQSHIDEHKVAFHDKMVNSTGLYSIAELAKTLGIGKNRLLAVMRKDKILMSGGKNHNQPYQKYIDHGWLTMKLCMTENKNKTMKMKTQPMITGKGVIRITELIEN